MDSGKITGNTPEQEEAIRKCREWYETDKEAKQFYVDEMREMYKLYKGDHWDLIGPGGSVIRTVEQQKNRPNSVENIVFAMVEGTASEFAQDIELIDYPVEDGDEDIANLMTELKKFLFYKNRISWERMKYLRWFFLYGTGIWHVYWDPEWSGGRGPNRWVGDVRWKALHPMCLIPDARCKEDINEGKRCHKRIWQPIETVKEQYPDRAHLIQEQTMDLDDLLNGDEIDSDGFGRSEFNREQIPVIETWYIGRPLLLDSGEKDEGIGLHVIWWAGESEGVYLNHANYIYFDPGETPQFPFIVRQCYPRENSIWGFGEAYVLKNPQIMRNKTAEIILEGHMHHALGQTFYRETAVTPKQKRIIEEKGTLPGMWFGMIDPTGFQRVHGQGVPASLQNEMTRNEKVMETLIGRFDISQGKTPGSVTAFKAIAELSARAQVRLRIKETAITSGYEEAGQYLNRLIFQNYQEERRFRVLGEEKGQTNRFRLEDILRVYEPETGMVMPYTQFNPAGLPPEELRAYFESQGKNLDDFEIYCPELDVMCKTTSVVPADRLYNMEIAKELLIGQVIDLETFFYVMKNGKFPPWEEIAKKMEQQQQMLAQQQAATGGQVPTDQATVEQQAMRFIESLPQEVQNYLAELPDEERIAEITRLMQEAGMNV